MPFGHDASAAATLGLFERVRMSMTLRDTPAEKRQIYRDALAAEQARSLAATDNWSHVDKPTIHADWDALYKELTPLLDRYDPQSTEFQPPA